MIGSILGVGMLRSRICRSACGLAGSGLDLGVQRSYFRVGITKLDGNVSYKLVLEPHSHDTRNGLDNGRLSVRDMADRAYGL